MENEKWYECKLSMSYKASSPVEAAEMLLDNVATNPNWYVEVKEIVHKASEHNWIAVSRDLLKRWGGQFDYGDKVCIKGAGHKDGVYTIVDTMNKRFISKIDFLETKGTKLYKYDNVLLAKL